MSFVEQCQKELEESKRALKLFSDKATAGLAYWNERIETLRNTIKLFEGPAPALPEINGSASEAPVEKLPEAEASSESNGPTEPTEESSAAQEDTSEGVETGRGGRPKLIDSMVHVLRTYGPMHPETMSERIVGLGRQPNSKKLVDYIRFCLSKNKGLFEKVPGQRGFWQHKVTTTKGGGTTAVVSPKAEDHQQPPEEQQPVELQKVNAFRTKEKTGVRLSLEEATRVVDEMTDPSKILEGTSTFAIPPT